MVLCFVSRCALTAAAGVRVSSGARFARHLASVRGYSEVTSRGHGPVCYALTHRALLKLEGADTSAFLQGIITNDVTLLHERAALYAHLLNVQGRTLYDVILYRLKGSEGADSVLMECDGTLRDSVLKHLKMYRIRRKVSVSCCPELSVWAVLSRSRSRSSTPDEPVQKPELSRPDRAVVWEADPRTALMGWRLVLQANQDPVELLKGSETGDTQDYHRHRYRIGLPEGVEDLPPGVALPLESNLVYLSGISFSKGCYIGQELTARTHHTGVVRKRLMPVRLSPAPPETPGGAALQTEAGKAAGKHRAGLGDLGLALVRTAHAQETLTLTTSGGEVVTLQAAVPPWWPKDQDV
ncbi:iron-sulfur cluster assembly factor IBA57, mitochondrial [Salarias fasciatus]|uniref:Iron-sulfur cluster assembly factor IBA57, mitochondrial n=1 Tax=Salarias fasciatus TaxID=181472 RepID=A0A672GL00_SALFA|nr:putative transferase CAF17, mitochondrial [Salarias fasciatus]